MNDSEAAIESSGGETVDSGAVGKVADSAGAAGEAVESSDGKAAVDTSNGDTSNGEAAEGPGKVDSAGAAVKAPTRRVDDCDWCTVTGDGRRGAE